MAPALVSIEDWFWFGWKVCVEFSGLCFCLYVCRIIIMFAAQFAVQPMSVVQAQGIDAVFECRYPGAQSYKCVPAQWRVSYT